MRKGNQQAKLAFDVFADRVRSAVGSLAVTMGGVDAMIFTDRIGEGFRPAVGGLRRLGVPGICGSIRPATPLARRTPILHRPSRPRGFL